VMVRRFARRYSDGSFNVASDRQTKEEAIRAISGSTDDDDTEIVEVEVEIVASHGRPKLKIVHDTCPLCGRSHDEDSP
jgi:hypothetical protein